MEEMTKTAVNQTEAEKVVPVATGETENSEIPVNAPQGVKGKKGKGGAGGGYTKVLGRILGYIFKRYRALFVVVVITTLVYSFANVYGMSLLSVLIDDALTPGIQNGMDAVIGDFTRIVVTMGITYIVGIACWIVSTQIMAVVTSSVITDMRIDMFTNMEKLPIKYFDTHAHGDIMSTYTNDVDAIRNLISQSIIQIISSGSMIIVLIVIMLMNSVWLFLVVCLGVAAMVFVSKTIGGKSTVYFVRQQRSLANVEGFIEETMNGQRVIKVFNHEGKITNKFDEINSQLYDDAFKANNFANILMPIIGNIGNFIYVVLALVGSAIMFMGGFNVSLTGISALSVGVMVVFLPMSRQFTNQIAMLSQQINSIAMGIAGGKRVFDLIDETPEVDDGYVELVRAVRLPDGSLTETNERTNLWAWKHPHAADGSVTYTELKGDIVMDNVDFGYVPEKIVLQDVSLHAMPGQKFAFVGSTGAGKTTITNLINRFYDIADGKIRYDGININKIKKNDLRRSLGVVLQDTNLFTGTVADNIRYGYPEASMDEVKEAARIAGADDFISRLPNGYDTVITGNGASLSQGQRQLLSVARAACANAPVLILDEATSSIDTYTERLVQRGMDNLMRGRTVFVIAHRLSTIHNSDAIIVLEHGKIIERGTHDELIKEKGEYYELYNGLTELE